MCLLIRYTEKGTTQLLIVFLKKKEMFNLYHKKTEKSQLRDKLQNN